MPGRKESGSRQLIINSPSDGNAWPEAGRLRGKKGGVARGHVPF